MKINNIDWKIEMNDSLAEDLFGQTNYALFKIYLNPMCAKENLKRTLLHEIMHAYCFSYGLLYFETYNREQLCEFISQNFINIFEAYNEALTEAELL